MPVRRRSVRSAKRSYRKINRSNRRTKSRSYRKVRRSNRRTKSRSYRKVRRKNKNITMKGGNIDSFDKEYYLVKYNTIDMDILLPMGNIIDIKDETNKTLITELRENELKKDNINQQLTKSLGQDLKGENNSYDRAYGIYFLFKKKSVLLDELENDTTHLQVVSDENFMVFNIKTFFEYIKQKMNFYSNYTDELSERFTPNQKKAIKGPLLYFNNGLNFGKHGDTTVIYDGDDDSFFKKIYELLLNSKNEIVCRIPIPLSELTGLIYNSNNKENNESFIASLKANISSRPFLEALSYVHSLKLKNHKEWSHWSKSDVRPVDIPSAPHKVYKDGGWKGWMHWLGAGAH